MSSQFSSNTAPGLAVRGFSYEDRLEILSALAEALAASGCWVHDRKTVSEAQLEYHLELPLCSAVDLYSGLMGSGLELTRDSHLELTGLCTVGRHNSRPQQVGRMIDVRLEVSFLEEIETVTAPVAGHA